MDLYYRADEGAGSTALRNSPVSVGAQHLAAASSRIALSLVWSIRYLKQEAYEHLRALLTVDSLWSLCIVLAGWLIATAVGGPVALAINAILIGWGLSSLWDQLGEILKEIKTWVLGAYDARNDQELTAASQHCAAALTAGGLTALELIVTHKAFRFAEGKIRERFRPPDWLGREYEAQIRAREEKSRSPVKRAIETAQGAGSGARGRGMQHAANSLPTGSLIVGGVVLALGTSAVLVWTFQEGKK